MMGMLTELVDWLEAYDTGALGLTEGTNIFKGVLNNTSVNAGSLVEYDGLGLVESQTSEGDDLTEMPRVQVMWRSSDYETGMSKIRTIWKALESITNETIGAGLYQRVHSDNSPFQVGKDENDRWLFACNFTVTREAS